MPLGGIECCTLFGNMTSVAGPHCLNPSRLPFVTYQSSYMRFVPECDCSLAAGCLTHHQVQRICQVTLLCDIRSLELPGVPPRRLHCNTWPGTASLSALMSVHALYPAMYSRASVAAYIHLCMPRGVIEPQGDYSTVGKSDDTAASSALTHPAQTSAHTSGTISPLPSPCYVFRRLSGCFICMCMPLR